jgi:hypothetical protein
LFIAGRDHFEYPDSGLIYGKGQNMPEMRGFSTRFWPMAKIAFKKYFSSHYYA